MIIVFVVILLCGVFTGNFARTRTAASPKPALPMQKYAKQIVRIRGALLYRSRPNDARRKFVSRELCRWTKSASKISANRHNQYYILLRNVVISLCNITHKTNYNNMRKWQRCAVPFETRGVIGSPIGRSKNVPCAAVYKHYNIPSVRPRYKPRSKRYCTTFKK